MIAYITFNSYDNSEFYLWDITTDRQTAIKDYKEKHLLFFYEGAQPDISCLVLAAVPISKSNYNLLKKYLESSEQRNKFERKVGEFLTSVDETEDYEEIFNEQGDFCIDAMRCYCEENDIELDEEDEIDELIAKLEEYEDHKEDLVPIFVNYIETYYGVDEQ